MTSIRTGVPSDERYTIGRAVTFGTSTPPGGAVQTAVSPVWTSYRCTVAGVTLSV
jgi:hypothetical protein